MLACLLSCLLGIITSPESYSLTSQPTPHESENENENENESASDKKTWTSTSTSSPVFFPSCPCLCLYLYPCLPSPCPSCDAPGLGARYRGRRAGGQNQKISSSTNILHTSCRDGRNEHQYDNPPPQQAGSRSRGRLRCRALCPDCWVGRWASRCFLLRRAG